MTLILHHGGWGLFTEVEQKFLGTGEGSGNGKFLSLTEERAIANKYAVIAGKENPEKQYVYVQTFEFILSPAQLLEVNKWNGESWSPSKPLPQGKVLARHWEEDLNPSSYEYRLLDHKFQLTRVNYNRMDNPYYSL